MPTFTSILVQANVLCHMITYDTPALDVLRLRYGPRLPYGIRIG